MTLANFDAESNLLDIDRDPEPVKRLPRWAIILVILVLTASASFGLGILADQSLHSQEGSETSANSLSVGSSPVAKGQIVADSSTHTYYLPWCTEAASISAANTVWFATAQAAQAAGYTAGQDCPGL